MGGSGDPERPRPASGSTVSVARRRRGGGAVEGTRRNASAASSPWGRSSRAAAWGLLLAIVLGGCSATVHGTKDRSSDNGIYHEVRPGENLWRIGKAYGISSRELARVNEIDNPDRVPVGKRLFIP